jgi:hypothetical protein
MKPHFKKGGQGPILAVEPYDDDGEMYSILANQTRATPKVVLDHGMLYLGGYTCGSNSFCSYLLREDFIFYSEFFILVLMIVSLKPSEVANGCITETCNISSKCQV